MSDKKYLVSESQLREFFEVAINCDGWEKEFKQCLKMLSPYPQKALSEMTEEDAKKLCEAMGWEFIVFQKHINPWDDPGFFSITATNEEGSEEIIEIFQSKIGVDWNPFNPFTLVDTLRELGYGKGVGE